MQTMKVKMGTMVMVTVRQMYEAMVVTVTENEKMQQTQKKMMETDAMTKGKAMLIETMKTNPSTA